MESCFDFSDIQEMCDKEELQRILENAFDIQNPTQEQQELIDTIKLSIKKLEETK